MVFLHIGAPKTGTTFLQEAMWHNRALLLQRGVTLPGRRATDHFYGTLDLRNLDFKGYDDPRTSGMWEHLVSRALAADTEKVVISHEVLCGADEGVVAEAVDSLRPATVHVVYGARDLARQLPAAWQESLKNRRRHTYRQFLAHTLGEHARDGAVADFWGLQDPVATLHTWSRVVPPEHIHVVTLPKSAGMDTLWQRFCAAIDIPGDGYDLEVGRNPSLSHVDADLLRRINRKLPHDLPWPEYEEKVKRRFNELADQTASGPHLVVPGRNRERVMQLAGDIRAELGRPGYRVVGDLDDLIPAPDAFGPVDPPNTEQMADIAASWLATTLIDPPRRSRPFQSWSGWRVVTRLAHRLGYNWRR